jgi:hypothetical protein
LTYARRCTRSAPHGRGIEADVVQQALHHRGQTARADVFGALVHIERNLRQPGDALIGVNSSVTRSVASKRLVLPHQRGMRLGEDGLEVLTESDCNSTRIGKRPCNSGIRSLGLLRWKAPEATNRM